MKRLFLIRKDLHMSTGLIAAQVAMGGEAYWLAVLRSGMWPLESGDYGSLCEIDGEVVKEYIGHPCSIKVYEVYSRAELMNVVKAAKDMGLEEGISFGLIKDACKNGLAPEEPGGFVYTGIWFAPLPVEQVRALSKPYELYKD